MFADPEDRGIKCKCAVELFGHKYNHSNIGKSLWQQTWPLRSPTCIFFHLHGLILGVLPATSNYTSCPSNSVILCFIVFPSSFSPPSLMLIEHLLSARPGTHDTERNRHAIFSHSVCRNTICGLIVKNMEKKHSGYGQVWRFLFMTNKVSENSNAELASLLDFPLLIQKE